MLCTSINVIVIISINVTVIICLVEPNTINITFNMNELCYVAIVEHDNISIAMQTMQDIYFITVIDMNDSE